MSIAAHSGRTSRAAPLLRVGLIGLTLALAALHSGASAGPAPSGQTRDARTPPGLAGSGAAPHAEGEVLIKFRPSASATERANVRAGLGAQSRRRFRSGAEQWRLPPGLSTEQAIARHRGNPHIEYIEPNFIVRATAVPDDPRYPDQWSLRNTGQTGGAPGADIDAGVAWEITTGSHEVVVAVIDTGVDALHVDLWANIFTNEGEIPGNGVDDDGNGFVDDVHGWDFVQDDNWPFDDADHGTHVAGIIGAMGDNGIGIAGIAWQVRILPIKFLDDFGYGTTADAAAAVEYATLMGADITNNSWGGGGFSQTLLDAIEEAAAADILFVAAAGNESRDTDEQPHYPSGYEAPNIIAVAASNDRDQLWGGSNYGAGSVDLAAPGVRIVSTVAGFRAYQDKSGTSMAAPHVAGVAALVRSLVPAIGVEALKARILASVDPLPSLQGLVLSGGRLNAGRATELDDFVPPAAIVDLAVQETGGDAITLGWTATGDDGLEGTASEYDVRYSTTPIDEQNFVSASRADGAPVPLPPGSPEVMRVEGLSFDTTYYFAVRVLDGWGNASPVSNMTVGTTLSAPQIVVDPMALQVELLAGQSAVELVTIENHGLSDLDFLASGIRVGAAGAAGENPVTATSFPGWSAGGPPPGTSDAPPAGYQALASEEITSVGAMALLLQDVPPWNTAANEYLLDVEGIPFDRLNSVTLPQIDLSNYRLVIVASDQPTSYYERVAARRQQIEDYLSAGGVLEFHAAGFGWSGGDSSLVTLPGGMKIAGAYADWSDVLLPSHPLVAGVGPEISGSFAGHAYFTDVPGEAVVIAESFGDPSLVEYPFGAGRVVATGLALEYGLSRGQGAGIVLENMIPYNWDVAPGWLTLGSYAGTVAPGGVVELTIDLDATALAPALHEAVLFVASNDPLRPGVSVPIALEVLPDLDRDGLTDASDNCPDVFNPLQEDGDGDAVGDLCDNCPVDPNEDQADRDGDDAGDACQPHLIVDGIQQDGGTRLEVRALASDPQGTPLSGRIDFTGPVIGSIDFTGGLPRIAALPPALLPGEVYEFGLTVTDGTTAPVSAEAMFLYQGESELIINHPPAAVMQAPAVAECDRPEGREVILDASASSDPNSAQPGDDIVSYEWFEDFGLPGERLLGTSAVQPALLSLGAHTVSLRVTDLVDESDVASALVEVADTGDPALVVHAGDAVLWPPNHRMVPVPVTWLATDLCDAAPAVVLESVSSSEPDDAAGLGDGATSGDIGGADYGLPDVELMLRAERAGGGPGRLYSATYRVTDGSGNSAVGLGIVSVPHDFGAGPETLLMQFVPNGQPGEAHLVWPAVSGSLGYDVIAADLSSATVSGGILLLPAAQVLAHGTAAIDLVVDGPVPAIGEAVIYLIQARATEGGTGYGTTTAPWPRAPVSCAGGCP